MIMKSKSSNIFSYENDRNLPLTSYERISAHSIIGTNTTGTSSSNTELEPIIWNEDDTLMIRCSTSSNDDDYERETISTDNEKSHRQFQLINGTPTIIYV